MGTSVKEFQRDLEESIKKGVLPLTPKTAWEAEYVYSAYLSVENKQAKHALLIQLAEILAMLRLRNPEKRFENIVKDVGIKKDFAINLLKSYANRKEEDMEEFWRDKYFALLHDEKEGENA
jgi:hypothetical protein